MSRIDPARLTRILSALRQPEAPTSSSRAFSPTQALSKKTKKGARDPAVLRARLRERLLGLKHRGAGFAEAAPIITVQEILRWEFGDGILDHTDFNEVTKKVATTMLADIQLQGAIDRIINDLVSVES